MPDSYKKCCSSDMKQSKKTSKLFAWSATAPAAWGHHFSEFRFSADLLHKTLQ